MSFLQYCIHRKPSYTFRFTIRWRLWWTQNNKLEDSWALPLSLSWTMAYWSVFQISSFLDFIRPPQNASWLYFYPAPWWETKSETLLSYSLYLSSETMCILLIPYIKVLGIKSILIFVWKLCGMSDKSCNSLYKGKNRHFDRRNDYLPILSDIKAVSC